MAAAATGPASGTGSSRSSTTTSPTWRAGTATSRTPGAAEGSLVKSGLFLREFVTVPWVHLDIAGTGYFRKALPFAARGATGVDPRDARRAGAGRGRLTMPDPAHRRPGDRRRRGPRRRCRPLRDSLAGARRGASRRDGRSTGGPSRAARSARSPSGCCPAVCRDTLALFAFGAWFVTLIVGLATDLDQRLLPDELTLPVIPLALLYAMSGLNPLVGGALLPAVLAAVLSRRCCTCCRSRSGPGRSGLAT